MLPATRPAVLLLCLGLLALAPGRVAALGSRYIDITTPGYAGGAPLTNFPLLVRLSTAITNFSYTLCRPDGADLVFQDIDQNVLTHEIDTWNTNGASFVWVCVPEMTNSTKVRLVFGDPGMVAPAFTTNGAVWADGYRAVWHMDDGTANTNILDSTANRFRGFKKGAGSPAETDAVVGKGQLFNQNNIDLKGLTDTSTTHTVSMWIKGSDRETINQHVFDVETNRFLIAWVSAIQSQIEFYQTGWQNFGSTPSKDVWHHIAVCCGGTEARLYVDGVLLGTKVYSGKDFVGGRVMLGSRFAITGTSWCYFAGLLDEVRVSSVLRSADWIAASHSNTVPGSAFTAYSPVGTLAPSLRIVGIPVAYGIAEPAYGLHEGLVRGHTYTCSVARVWTNATEDIRYFCTGWKRYGIDRGTFAETPLAEGYTNEMDYIHGDLERLEWHFSHQYKVTATAGEGGSVWPAEGWVDNGSNVTFTATPTDESRCFYKWEGDVPEAKARENPLTLAADQARSVSALFGRRTHVADGLVAAVAAAEDGDLLILDAAEYTFDGTLTVDKEITLRGAGAGLTILRGSSGTGRHVSVNHAGAVIEGVTIQGKTVNSISTTGFGVRIGANGGTVRDSRVTGFTAGAAGQTGAVELNSANAVLEDCVVDGNNVAYGTSSRCWCGGVYLQKGVVRGCRILANIAHQAAGLYITGGTADGCLIAANSHHFPNSTTATFGTGAGVYASGGLVTNCVITANRATIYSGVGGVHLEGTGAKLADCVIRGNITPAIPAAAHPDLDCSSLLATSNVSRCRLPTAFGADCVTNAVLFRHYAGGDYTVVEAIGVDKTETLLGGAFTFTSADPGASWTVTDAADATVETGTGVKFVFTPAAAGLFTVALDIGGGRVAATNAVKAGPVEVTVSDNTELIAALEAAVDGTAITLADGNFILDHALLVTKGVTLQGSGWGRCTLKLKDGVKDRVIFLNHKGATVTGLTAAKGWPAFQSDSSYSVKNPTHGTTVRIGAIGGRMTRCRITGAIGGAGTAHYLCGAVAILSADGYVGQCLIDNNVTLYQTGSGSSYGGGLLVAAGLAESCLITNNLSMYGGGVAIGGTGKLRNCTVAGNEAYKTAGGILWLDGSAARVVNCVFAGSRSGPAFDTTIGRPEWAPITVNSTQYANMTNGFSHCAFVGSEAVGADSFQTVAPFVDFAGGDLHPLFGSAGLVDKGTTDDGLAAKDFDGNDRTQGSDPDIGCFEADASVVSCAFSVDKTVLFQGEKVKLTPEIFYGDPGVTYAFAWTLTDRFGSKTMSTDTKPELELPCGWYSVALSAWDPALPAGIFDAVPLPDYIHVAPKVMFVVAGTNAASAYPYDSLEKAATNMAHTLAEMVAGATIMLGEGVHGLRAEIILDIAVTITGAGCDRSILTLLSSAPNSRVLTINSAAAVVERVGITGSKLDARDVGTGVWIGPLGGTLRDCRVFGNKAKTYYQYGAGVAVTGSKGLVQRCVIECNTNAYREAQVYGGGIYLAAGRAENCLIRGNLSYFGGGAAVKPNGLLRNCTVVDNAAIIDVEKKTTGGYGGGIYLLGGRVENTVFWGNTSERAGYTGDPEWYGLTKTVFLKCALPTGVATNATTGGDFLMLADPCFRDAAGGGFRLRSASPLVNAGANQDITAEDLDLDGLPRIFGFGTRSGLVDIGCYESQVRASTLILVR